MEIDFEELLSSIIGKLDKENQIRKIIDVALEEQGWKYNEEGRLETIHTNPFHAAFDDPDLFKIGDVVKNKNSGITARITTYLDGYYGLSNGCRIPIKNKDNWEIVE